VVIRDDFRDGSGVGNYAFIFRIYGVRDPKDLYGGPKPTIYAKWRRGDGRWYRLKVRRRDRMIA
jgi:hypothetical protein